MNNPYKSELEAAHNRIQALEKELNFKKNKAPLKTKKKITMSKKTISFLKRNYKIMIFCFAALSVFLCFTFGNSRAKIESCYTNLTHESCSKICERNGKTKLIGGEWTIKNLSANCFCYYEDGSFKKKKITWINKKLCNK